MPGLGDAIGGLLACYGLAEGIRLRVPLPIFARMIGNILVDMLIGEVPLLGDLLDVTWQANQRNLALLEAWRGDPQAVRSESATGLVVLGVLALLALLAAAGMSLLIARSLYVALTRLL